MKYENAKDILPEHLLAEVQKYAGGKLLYIPVENEPRSWGEVSGYRQRLLKRNVMICNRYQAGATLSELAQEYFLSLDSIKKIVYGKKDKKLFFEPTVESSVNYANAGLLEEWLLLFYSAFYSEKVPEFKQVMCCGVLKVPLRLIEDEKEKGEESTAVEKRSCNNREPLMLRYKNGIFCVDCQYDLFHEIRLQKVNAYPALLMVQKEEYKQFERMFGRYFIVVG